MISVVMPTFDTAPFVARAIESVLAQTFTDFELIVCDDGSADGTLDIVDAYARRDPRIRVLRHGFRSPSLNCNAAVRAARHPWIARLDADDVMVPRRLEWQLEAAARDPSVALWGGHVLVVDRHDRPLWTITTGPTDDARYRRLRDTGDLIVIQGPSVMVRRDLFLELGGYDRTYDVAEDLELLARIARRAPVRILPRVLTHYRLHGTSITAARAAHQLRLLNHVVERNRAWRDGRPEEDFAAYAARLDAAPWPARLAERVEGLARQTIRDANLHWAERRRVRALAAAGAAALLNPRFAVERVASRLRRIAVWRLRWIHERLRPAPIHRPLG